MAATSSLGAEQTLCRAFHSVVCFSRSEALAYANFSFAGETLYRLYRLSLPPSVDHDDDDDGWPHRHGEFFPELASCRREIFDDLDHYGMAIDPSLCDYGRKNETEIREVDRLSVRDASLLGRRIDETALADEMACRRRLLIAVAVFGVTGAYAAFAHLVRCVSIVVERRRRTKSPASSSRCKQRRPDSDHDENPKTHSGEDQRDEYALQRHDGWVRCNGQLQTASGKAETNTFLLADDRTLASSRSAAEDDPSADRQTKILSVTNCCQHAQISI